MATIVLHNRTGLALRRLMSSGTGQLLAAPVDIAVDATVQWQVTGPGSVTYGLPPPQPGMPPLVIATLTWDATAPGRFRYGTRDVRPDIVLRAGTTATGGEFTIRRGRRRVPPVQRPGGVGRGQSRVPPWFPVVLGIVLVLGVTVPIAIAGAGKLFPRTSSTTRGGGNSQGSPGRPKPPTPTLTLGADQSSLMTGQTVHLTAHAANSVDLGSAIEIVDISDERPFGPCAQQSTCHQSDSQNQAVTITYQAFIVHIQDLNGHFQSSPPVTVTWNAPPPVGVTVTVTVPPTTKYSVALSVDNSHPQTNTHAYLTATASPAVDGSGYSIDIIDLTLGTEVCSIATGTTCKAPILARNPVTRTFQAFVEMGQEQHLQAASNRVTVTWVAPTPPPSVTLAVDNANPGIGGTINLTATTPTAVDGTSYLIDMYDNTDSASFAVCRSGKSCAVTLQDSSCATIQFQAFVERQVHTAEIASNTVTVTWGGSCITPMPEPTTPVPPPTPMMVTFTSSVPGYYNATFGFTFVEIADGSTAAPPSTDLAATTDVAVDASGEQIVIALVAMNEQPVSPVIAQHCSSGTACDLVVSTATLSTGTPGMYNSLRYQAFVESGDGTILLASTAIYDVQYYIVVQ